MLERRIQQPTTDQSQFAALIGGRRVLGDLRGHLGEVLPGQDALANLGHAIPALGSLRLIGIGRQRQQDMSQPALFGLGELVEAGLVARTELVLVRLPLGRG